jgi:hypothetical protein
MNHTNRDLRIAFSLAAVLFIAAASFEIWMLPQHWNACGVLYSNNIARVSCMTDKMGF